MKRRVLRFQLSSYWHVGSGAGAGTVADAVVLRDGAGLPVIPGRTIKGLLRDCMGLASLSQAVPPDRVTRWFGSSLAGQDRLEDTEEEQDSRLEEGRFTSQEGELWFGSAQLPPAWREWARGQPQVDSLYTLLASTSLDEEGVARDGTLRVVEATVPMVLEAEVTGPEGDDSWVADLRACVPLLRALGSRRNRGFGRVDVTLEEAP